MLSATDRETRRAIVEEYFSEILARFNDRLPELRAELARRDYQDVEAVIAEARAEIEAARAAVLAEIDAGRGAVIEEVRKC